MTLRSNLIYSALFAASVAAAPAAWAQVQEPAPPAQEYPSPAAEAPPVSDMPESNAAASTTISDQKIEQFADAYVAVQTIQEKAATQLQTAKEPAQADQVKAKAESDMIAAVEKSGLKVDEFNMIVETMTANADVRERVAAKLQERQGGG
jgi:DNA primase